MPLKLRIREMREARGWRLETLADKIGTSPPHLSQVERGIKNLNSGLIERISAALDVEPFELFAPRQDPDDIARLIADLPEADRERVRAFAAALASTRQENDEQ